MEPFEYVMVLVSIVVGLGVTHILTAIGAAVHRLRGQGASIRLEPVYLLWVLFVLIWLISFWWWEFKFQDALVTWSFGLYLFIILYAVVLFLMAVLLVPERMEGIHDSYEYFMAVRPWFFSALIAGNGIDVVDTAFKGGEWLMRPLSFASVLIYFGVGVVGLLSTRRTIQLANAITAVALQVGFTFADMGILGGW